MTEPQAKLWRWILGGVIFILSFALFAWTAPHTVQFVDNAEFITAAKVLGVAHPGGFPLYVLLGHFFSYLPLGSLAFRINLLSAVFASLGLVVFYLVGEKILRLISRRPQDQRMLLALSAAAALILGFGTYFWQESNVAEVYSLNFLLFMVLTWLLLRYREQPTPRLLYCSALVYGLALTNHEIMVLFLPLFLGAFIYFSPKLGRRVWLVACGWFLLGFALYLYVPLRSAMNPPLDWGYTHVSFRAWLQHILRLDYKDLLDRGWSWPTKAAFLAAFARNVYEEFLFTLVFVPLGLFALIKRNKFLLLFSAAAIFINSAVVISLRSIPVTGEALELYAQNYQPAFSMVALWILAGLWLAYQWLADRNSSLAQILTTGLASVFVVLIAFSAYPDNNWRQFTFLDSYSYNILEKLPPHSVFLFSMEGTEVDSLGFALLYQHVALGLRPDVTIVSYPNSFKLDDRERRYELNQIFSDTNIYSQRRKLVQYALKYPDLNQRPIDTSFLVDGLAPGWHSVSNGYAYALSVGGKTPAIAGDFHPQIDPTNERLLRQNYFGRDILAAFYYNQAALALAQNNRQAAQDLYIQAIQVDNDLNGGDMVSYRIYRDESR